MQDQELIDYEMVDNTLCLKFGLKIITDFN